MPCKHFGGTDECVRYPSGGCKERVNQQVAAYQKHNPERVKEKSRTWYQRNKKRKHMERLDSTTTCGAYSKATKGNLGKAAECLVLCDMLFRGLEVTEPKNVNTPDDLHAKCGGKWFTVQVKIGRTNSRTGSLVSCTGRNGISSEILAVVDVPSRRVRYISNHGVPMPPELL